MRKSLGILLIFTYTFVHGQQDYIDYYNLCNQADRAIYLKHYDQALQHFKKAFGRVDYVHARQLAKASLCAVKTADLPLAYRLAQRALVNGQSPDFLKKKSFKKLRRWDQFDEDSLLFFSKRHTSSIDQAYRQAIDSLFYVDQRIIRNNPTIEGDYLIDESSLPENRFELDSLVFGTLLELVHQNGFPSEQSIGPASYHSASLLIHHHFRLPKHTKYLEMAEVALKSGQYLPEDYAWMYDQSLLFRHEKPRFHYGGVTLPWTLSDEEKTATDQTRSAYGVKPLAAYKVKKTRKGILQIPLWRIQL